MTSLKRTVAAACLAVVSLTGACAGDGGSASAAPESYVIEQVHVSFDLPLGWDKLDRETLQDVLADSELTDEMTDRMGMTSEEVRQILSTDLVVYVTAPRAVHGFLDNLGVVVTSGALPSWGLFERQYRRAGATDLVSRDLTTAVGDGFTTTYQLEVGTIRVYGEVIALGVDGQSVVITISGHDASDTARLTEDLVDSLAPAA